MTKRGGSKGWLSNHKRFVTAGGQVLRKKRLFGDDRNQLASLTFANSGNQESAKLSKKKKSKLASMKIRQAIFIEENGWIFSWLTTSKIKVN